MMIDDPVCKFLQHELNLDETQFELGKHSSCYIINCYNHQRICFWFENDTCFVQRDVYLSKMFFEYEIRIDEYQQFIMEEYDSHYYSVLHKKDGIIQCDIIRKKKSEREEFEKDVFHLYDVEALKKDVIGEIVFLYGDPEKKINGASIRRHYYNILKRNFGDNLRESGGWTSANRIVFDCPKQNVGSIAVEIIDTDRTNYFNYEKEDNGMLIQMFSHDEEIGFYIMCNQAFDQIFTYMQARLTT